MRATRRYTVAWAAALLLAAAQAAMPAAASAPRATQPPSDAAACQLPAQAGDAHPLADRAESLSRYEALPPQCLKALFMVCTEAARTQLLDLGSAAACSIGYEALLRTGFGGSFQALMAWWHTQRTGAPLTP